MNKTIVIRRYADVLSQTGFTKSSLYDHIRQGIFPPPISLGTQSRGFISYEIDAFLSARSNGLSDQEVSELVKSMVDARKERCSEYSGFLRTGE